MFRLARTLSSVACIAIAFASVHALAQFKAAAPAPASEALAALADPSTELLHSSKVKLTRGDYDTQLLRLPENTRAGFGTNIDRINTVLRVILVDKTLAGEARAAGLATDPETMNRIAAETDRILSEAMMKRNQEQWEKEFDARPNLDVAARERWLTQPDKYREPEQVQVTQIRYEITGKDADKAKEKAEDARRRIAAGGDMSAIAKTESDDPAAAQTAGKLDWRTLRAFDDPRLARAISGLKNIGDITRPIETDDAVYVVRLDARRPGEKLKFDDVKASIIADLRKDYVDTMRSQKMASIRNDPSIVVNQPAVEALVTRIDPSYTNPSALGGAERSERPAPGGRGGKGGRQLGQ